MTTWLNGSANMEEVERSVLEISQVTDEARRLIQSLTPQLTRLRSLQKALPEPESEPQPAATPAPQRTDQGYPHLPNNAADADQMEFVEKLRKLQRRLKAWENEILAELAEPTRSPSTPRRIALAATPQSITVAPQPRPSRAASLQHRPALAPQVGAPTPEARRTVHVTIASLGSSIDAHGVSRVLAGLPGVSELSVMRADRSELSVTLETDRVPTGLPIRDALLSVSPEGVSGGWDGDDQFIAVLGRPGLLRGSER